MMADVVMFLNSVYSRSRACTDYQVNVVRDDFITGWRQGIREYCVYSQGYMLGKSEANYSSACPIEYEPDFATGYLDGIQSRIDKYQSSYELSQRRIGSLNQQIREELQRIKYRSHHYEHEYANTLNQEVMSRIKNAHERIEELQKECPHIREEVNQLQHQANLMKQR